MNECKKSSNENLRLLYIFGTFPPGQSTFGPIGPSGDFAQRFFHFLNPGADYRREFGGCSALNERGAEAIQFANNIP